VTADIDQTYLDYLENKRNDMAKIKDESPDLSESNEDGTLMGLHNSN